MRGGAERWQRWRDTVRTHQSARCPDDPVHAGVMVERCYFNGRLAHNSFLMGDAAADDGPKEDPTRDPPPPPPPGRMGACEVCEEAPPAKYRCPACSVATC